MLFAIPCKAIAACLLTTGVVVVPEDDDVATGERLDAILGPLGTGHGGGAMSEGCDAVGVFLAFANKHGGIGELQ
jgi:hypothetical protein